MVVVEEEPRFGARTEGDVVEGEMGSLTVEAPQLRECLPAGLERMNGWPLECLTKALDRLSAIGTDVDDQRRPATGQPAHVHEGIEPQLRDEADVDPRRAQCPLTQTPDQSNQRN